MDPYINTSNPLGKIIPLSKPRLESKPTKKIAITIRNSISIIDLDQISYLESDGNYTKLVLACGKKILTCKTLKRFETRINNQHFLRIHNSFIINTAQLSSYDLSSNHVEMGNGNLIPVSRARKRLLMEYLKELML